MEARRKSVAAVAAWACCAGAIVGVATYQGRADATVPADALQCDEDDLVISTVFEPDPTKPGASSPEEALEGLHSAYRAEDVAGMQATERADDHAVFVRSAGGKQQFVAKLAEDGGWRLEAAAACVRDQKGGRS